MNESLEDLLTFQCLINSKFHLYNSYFHFAVLNLFILILSVAQHKSLVYEVRVRPRPVISGPAVQEVEHITTTTCICKH